MKYGENDSLDSNWLKLKLSERGESLPHTDSPAPGKNHWYRFLLFYNPFCRRERKEWGRSNVGMILFATKWRMRLQAIRLMENTKSGIWKRYLFLKELRVSSITIWGKGSKGRRSTDANHTSLIPSCIIHAKVKFGSEILPRTNKKWPLENKYKHMEMKSPVRAIIIRKTLKTSLIFY